MFYLDVAYAFQVFFHVFLLVFSYACFKCFKYFSGMLQGFHMDIAKVDRDVIYVAIVVHLCWKGLFPMFHLFF